MGTARRRWRRRTMITTTCSRASSSCSFLGLSLLEQGFDIVLYLVPPNKYIITGRTRVTLIWILKPCFSIVSVFAIHITRLNQGQNVFLKKGRLQKLRRDSGRINDELKDALLLTLRQRLQCCGLARDNLGIG
jgi:hypothetical protein